ncbi:MAG: carbon-phosphorus lyase complex subunit PhnI [Coriobacteriia bacterium]|nr:carbon-phosphorus lyase complex subunit PhnI [Coriobacteriia bacterium]
MAYVAVSGGEEAIAASLELLRRELIHSQKNLSVATIVAALPELVDQVMGESSLYDPSLAALALKQGGGSVEEAVFLLRAFRSTLERPYVSRVIETESMAVSRRISAAFKDIPDGQILGVTRDYSHRLIDFSLADGVADEEGTASPLRVADEEGTTPPLAVAPTTTPPLAAKGGYQSLQKVADYLHEIGLLQRVEPDDTEPCDITMEPLVFPAARSARLQALARGMTQAVMALGYAGIRGFGPAHPTVGELRYGHLPVLIDHPIQPGDEADAYYVGSIAVTEVESLFSVEVDSQAANSAANSAEPSSLAFGIGYGLVYGRAESKAIAMSVLDFCLSLNDPRYPTQDEEFVLYHIDGIEATGFISHLKLPHYVTFQSKLSSARITKEGQDK